jgi:hypothetical protein
VRKVLFLAAAALALAACNRGDPRDATIEPREHFADAADEGRKAKPLPDAELTDIVRSAIISDSSLDANRIDVENKQGDVSLYGSVDTPEQREKAERIVNSVGGVKTVANHLTVSQRSDDRSGARSAAAGGTALPDPDIEMPAQR